MPDVSIRRRSLARAGVTRLVASDPTDGEGLRAEGGEVRHGVGPASGRIAIPCTRGSGRRFARDAAISPYANSSSTRSPRTATGRPEARHERAERGAVARRVESVGALRGRRKLGVVGALPTGRARHGVLRARIHRTASSRSWRRAGLGEALLLVLPFAAAVARQDENRRTGGLAAPVSRALSPTM
jgi:hypothetical protein